MPPDVIDAVCMTTGGEEMNTTALPPGAITVSDVIDGQVGFTVSQLWADDAGIAIQTGMDACIVNGNVTLGDTEDLIATCREGYAGVTIVVYLDEDFDPDECDACDVTDISELGGDSAFCAYRVEIPCDTVEVECGEPSAAPSGSYYPSSVPTDTPTESLPPTDSPTESPTEPPTNFPTDSPTESPTVSPTEPPTDFPTVDPTESPTVSPTEPPTDFPSEYPTTGEPTGSPTESCPEGEAVLISNEGLTMYPELPIKINMQNETHVAFEVQNTFGQIVSSVFTQYHSGSFGETECLEEENVEDQVPIEFVAQCMRHTKISIVNVWITDCSSNSTSFLEDGDDAEIPECCHGGDECKTVQYTFKLPCVDPCPPEDGGEAATEAPEDRRRLVADKIRERKAQEGSTSEFEELTGVAAENDREDHFCVIEDYPCGPHHDKVHVCHYSARDGYKTFCVPEADSDALRFYPKDYCGPCVGGYATSA